jgi:hypothetical protein
MGTQLSEVKLPSKDTRFWLDKETRQTFVPVHAKARKLLDEMRKNLETLSEASKMLLENSAKEIEKRNMKTHGRARAMNKLARLFVDRMRLRILFRALRRLFLLLMWTLRIGFPESLPSLFLTEENSQPFSKRLKTPSESSNISS